MTKIDKAYALLIEWSQYKTVHYSSHTQFDKAIDIELEKEALTRLSRDLNDAIISDDKNELDFLIRIFEEHLTIFKDQITIEVLRTGVAEVHV
jgi:hypothetical protein